MALGARRRASGVGATASVLPALAVLEFSRNEKAGEILQDKVNQQRGRGVKEEAKCIEKRNQSMMRI